MTTDKDQCGLSKVEVNYSLESEYAQNSADRIKILVVEDDHTTQLLYDKGLSNQIFDKKMVISGKEALLVYAEWHPDIIVLDIYVPEITGYQVLKAIRTAIQDKETTIVMATSLSATEDVMSCMKLGVEGYIIKPFQCTDIGIKVLSYYAKKKPERAVKAEALCREFIKQSSIRSLPDKDKLRTEENTEGVSGDTTIADTGNTERGNEINEMTLRKPQD